VPDFCADRDAACPAAEKKGRCSARQIFDPGVHGWYRPEIADRDIDEIKAIGFTWVKQRKFAWRDIEGRERGAFVKGPHPDEIIYQREQ